MVLWKIALVKTNQVEKGNCRFKMLYLAIGGGSGG